MLRGALSPFCMCATAFQCSHQNNCSAALKIATPYFVFVLFFKLLFLKEEEFNGSILNCHQFPILLTINSLKEVYKFGLLSSLKLVIKYIILNYIYVRYIICIIYKIYLKIFISSSLCWSLAHL